MLIFLHSLSCREGDIGTVSALCATHTKLCEEAEALTVAIRTLDRPQPKTGMQGLGGRVSAQNTAEYYGPTSKLRLGSDEVRARRVAVLPQGFILRGTKPLPPQESSKQQQGQWDYDEGARARQSRPFFCANDRFPQDRKLRL